MDSFHYGQQDLRAHNEEHQEKPGLVTENLESSEASSSPQQSGTDKSVEGRWVSTVTALRWRTTVFLSHGGCSCFLLSYFFVLLVLCAAPVIPRNRVNGRKVIWFLRLQVLVHWQNLTRFHEQNLDYRQSKGWPLLRLASDAVECCVVIPVVRNCSHHKAFKWKIIVELFSEFCRFGQCIDY